MLGNGRRKVTQPDTGRNALCGFIQSQDDKCVQKYKLQVHSGTEYFIKCKYLRPELFTKLVFLRPFCTVPATPRSLAPPPRAGHLGRGERFPTSRAAPQSAQWVDRTYVAELTFR